MHEALTEINYSKQSHPFTDFKSKTSVSLPPWQAPSLIHNFDPQKYAELENDQIFVLCTYNQQQTSQLSLVNRLSDLSPVLSLSHTDCSRPTPDQAELWYNYQTAWEFQTLLTFSKKI